MKPQVSQLTADMSAAEGTRVILLELLSAIEYNLPGARSGDDPEHLHDLRVAVRRTRSALDQIPDTVPEPERSRFADEFKWLGQATGPARDLDVYLANFHEYRDMLAEEDRPSLEALHTFLKNEHRAAHQTLNNELDSPRFHGLMEQWSQFIGQAWDAPGDQGTKPVKEVADGQIARLMAKAIKQGSKLDDASPADRYHRLRKTCKKLRYLLEFFRTLYPKSEVRKLIKRLKGLQDDLGVLQDMEVQGQYLTHAGRALAAQRQINADTLMVLGVLKEKLAQRKRRARHDFVPAFEKFSSAKNLRRAEKLFGRL